MKKAISILICILVLMISLCTIASATTHNTYVYEVDGNEYTIEFHDNNLTAEEQIIVSNKLLGIYDDTVQTYGLGCTLFGHDYKNTTTSVIHHKVYADAPRCKKEVYDVTYCADCDYTKQTLLNTTYIYCCPED